MVVSGSRLSKVLVCADLRWFGVWLGVGIGLIAALFYVSLSPPLVRMPAEHFDKLYHAGHYALIMAWFVQLYRGARSYLILALGFTAMGAGIEVLQSFHPMRYFDVLDMLANAVGVAFVWAIARGGFVTILQRIEGILLPGRR